MKKIFVKRIMPLLLSIITLFSAAVPAFAADTDTSKGETSEAVSAAPSDEQVISTEFENGIITLSIDANLLYNIICDKSLTKEELKRFLPEEVLNSLDDGISKEALTEIVSQYLTADNISELISALPTGILFDYFDLSLIESILSVDDLLSIIPLDTLLKDVTEESLEKLITSEAFKLILTEEMKTTVLTDDFISGLLEDGEIVDKIVADESIHDPLAKLVDGVVVDKILKNDTAKQNLIALAESEAVLNAVLGNPDLLNSVQDYMFSHTEKIDKFLSDTNVIGPLRNSEVIRAHVADLIAPQYLINEIHPDFEDLADDFGITEDYIKDNATRLGLTSEDLDKYTTLEALIVNDAIDLEVLCEDKAITVEKLIYYGHVSDAELAHLISDNWGNVVNDDSFAKDIIGVVGIHAIFEDFGRDDIINDVFGGYYGMIEKGLFTEKDVVKAVGGYAAIVDYLLPEKLNDVIDIVGYEKWKEFIDIKDVIDAAGGYTNLVKVYTISELNEIIQAIGKHNIKIFLDENGIRDKLNIGQLVKDLIIKIAKNKDGFKTFAKNVLNRIMQVLNKEFSYINLNDTTIYKNGSFFIDETFIALLKVIPDIDTVLSMESGDSLTKLVLSAPIRGEMWQIGVDVKLTGDLTSLKSLLEDYSEFFTFDVTDQFDVSVGVTVPSAFASLYEKALLSDKLPAALKTKLLELPTMSVADVADMLENLTDDEISELASEFSSKAEEIKEKLYEKIDEKAGDIAAVQKAKEKVDQLIDKISDPEKLSALRDKAVAAVDKAAGIIGDGTIASLYEGNSTFEAERTFYIDFYEIINKVITLPDEALLLFDNDMAISGTIDATVKINGIHKVTIVDSDGSTKEFFLPEGMDMGILNEYGGVETDLSGQKVPSEDSYILPEDSYLLIFRDKDKKVIKEITYTKSEAPDIKNYPSVPVIPGYTEAWSTFTIYSDLVIYVDPVYTAINYNAGYKLNGQYISIGTITVETKSVKLPLSVTSPDGYSFGGWFIDYNGNDTLDENDFLLVKTTDNEFAPPSGRSFPLASVVFAPLFTMNQYTAKFYDGDTEFGSAGFNASNRKVTVPANDPTAAYGYTFDGWYVDTDGDGKGDLKLTDSYVPPYKNLSIYANYTLNTHDVYLIVDGVKKKLDINSSVETIYFMLTPPEKAHYDFEGFYYDANNNGKIDEGDVKLIRSEAATRSSSVRFDLPEGTDLPDADVQIIANFTPIEYSLTLSDRGTETTVKFSDATVLISLPIPTPDEGYYFVGWFMDLDGDGVYETELKDGDGPTYIMCNYAGKTAIAKYEKYTYTATFEPTDGFEGKTVTFEYGTTKLPADAIPECPAKYGYFGEWYVRMADGNDIPLSEYTLENRNISIYAKYVAKRVFRATFYVDGKILTTVDFFEGDTALSADKIPVFPEKLGYNGEWYVQMADGNDLPLSEYTLCDRDIVIYANYVAKRTFKAKFVADGEVITVIEFTEGATSLPADLIPAVPAKIGYSGVWADYILEDKDIIINAIYTANKYKAKFIVDDEVISVIEFTVETKELENIPTVPEKLGYTGEWEKYTLVAKDIEIHAVYTLKTFKATFVADGVTVAVIDFTVNDKTIEEPAVPAKEGYTGKWEEYTLKAEDITIKAVYTAIVVEPDEPDVPTEPDPIGDDTKKNSSIAWWILLAIGIILLIIWIFSKRKDDDDDDTPEPPAETPAPEVVPPAPAPVAEPIETVEEIDVETADKLMTDATAMAVVETVSGAGVGMKAIVNVCDINKAFNSGDVVDIDALKAKKLIPAKAQRVKVLADGSIDKAITVYAEQFSVQAIKMITLTGGKAIQKK